MSRISQGLQKAFNIEQDEGRRVLLLILQSFFIGIFIGVFDVGAHGIFLKVYPETMIAKAYLISGLAGIVLTSLYTSLQGRMKFAHLTSLNLIFIALVTMALRFGFEFTKEKLLAFILIVFMGPLKINAIVGYNGTVVRMFTLRQGKRLYGLVDSGLILGLILSGYSVSLLMGFNFAVKNLFIISAVSIFIAVFIQLIISRKFNLEVTNKEENKAAADESGLKKLLRNKYVRLMAIFVILSMIVSFFLQYSFLGVLKANYPDNRELTVFLGAFMSTLYVFTILVKTFVYSKFIKAYGLKSTLIISSLVLLVFTVIASILGSFFGFTAAAGGFTFFFLVISLSRLFVQAFKDAFEVPSFKLLYQSLSLRIRHTVQAHIDGTINEFAAVFSGIMLTVLISLSFIKLIHFTYVLGIILIVWAFIASRLYRQYRKSLEKSLAETKDVTHISSSDLNQLFHNTLNISNHEETIKALDFIKLSEPQLYQNALMQSLTRQDQTIRNYIIDEIREMKSMPVLESIEEEIDNLREEKLKEALKSLIQEKGRGKKIPGGHHLEKLTRSNNPEDRMHALRFIANSGEPQYLSLYSILLRDLVTEVRIMAIQLAPKAGYIETIPVITDYLGSRQYYSYAFNSLQAFGDKAFKHLEHGFYKTGTDDKVVIRIIRLISKIGTPEAISFLLGKIDHYNREIMKECVAGLIANKFRADEETIGPMQQAITKTISIASWNLAAKLSIDPAVIDPYLSEALEEEAKCINDLLFSLLSLAYDPQSIMHVRENLESGTSEGVSYAIELMDTFVAEELKPTLFTLLEDTPPADKIRRLQNEFPIEKMDSETLLISLINSDFHYINNWTRLCAIENLNYLTDFKINNAVIAQLFNPSKLLHEGAALLIHQKEPEKLLEVLPRIDSHTRASIEASIKSRDQQLFHLQSQKMKYLKLFRIFNPIPSKTLLSLCDLIEDITLQETQEIILSTESNIAGLCMVPEGEIEVTINDEIQKLLTEFQCFNTYHFKEIKKMVLKAKKDSYIYLLKLSRMNELMFDYPEITDILLHISIQQTEEALLVSM